VTEGVVTLTGELDTRTDAEVAGAHAHRGKGRVDVVDRLTWQVQDRPDTIPVHRCCSDDGADDDPSREHGEDQRSNRGRRPRLTRL
jgi:hypothetical protein